jgi:MFS family permease
MVGYPHCNFYIWKTHTNLDFSCALQPLTGKMYSQFSLKVYIRHWFRRWEYANFLKYTFLVFLVLFEVGSAICGSAQSSKMLIIGRAVAGLGGSGLRNGALNVITECIPLSKRPRKCCVLAGAYPELIRISILWSHDGS